MTVEIGYMSHLYLISPRMTTYEDVLLVNWSWLHCSPLLTTGICYTILMQCLCTNTLYLGQTQHLCEGVTKSSTSTLLKESVTTLFLLDVLFFLSLTPWRRNSGLMQDLAIMAKSQPNAQPFLCFLLVSTTKQSFFFLVYLVMHHAEPGTRRQTLKILSAMMRTAVAHTWYWLF